MNQIAGSCCRLHREELRGPGELPALTRTPGGAVSPPTVLWEGSVLREWSQEPLEKSEKRADVSPEWRLERPPNELSEEPGAMAQQVTQRDPPLACRTKWRPRQAEWQLMVPKDNLAGC